MKAWFLSIDYFQQNDARKALLEASAGLIGVNSRPGSKVDDVTFHMQRLISSLFDLKFGHYNCFFDAKEKSSGREQKSKKNAQIPALIQTV